MIVSLSLFLAPSWTRRGSGCGMVVHRDQWSSVGDRVWCSTGSNSAWQYSLMRYRYHRFATKYIPSETLQTATNWTLRRQNKEGIEHKRVRRVESLEEKKSASPYTPDLSLPWSDSKIRVWKYAKKIRNKKLGFLNERNLKNGKQLKLGMERIGKTHFGKQGSLFLIIRSSRGKETYY